ncbi:hypothetical protein BDY17DRAFT_305793 [Neohortaea acidophila]|uniref:Uncharacterized protein n=1 Tax=Neohortaea acidophila TaxID=245834 RepID=A0A6A6PFJ6_9PEZI|nr:uncharacterized protein BDY17DRAFT_305793 [Neohortaea acidophila]KAF2478758.1 hypothetical protein BDY17DRAFT_305793 [Neohortaea acidophila]
MDHRVDALAKRKNSRSPEGGQPRKMRREEPITTKDNPVRPQTAAEPARDPRLAKQTKNPSRHASPHASSPLAPGSRNGSSGNSTPIDGGRVNGTVDEPDSILGLLTTFRDQITNHVCVKLAYDEASRRHDRACIEYDVQAKLGTLKQFPSIGEQKTRNRDVARKEMEQQERIVQKHKASHALTMSKLAKMIGETQQPASADFVSRAEFAELQTSVTELKATVQGVHSTVNNMQVEVETALPAAQEARDRVSKVEAAVTEAQEGTKRLASDVRRATADAQSARDRMDRLQAHELSKYATKEAIEGLKKEYTDLNQAVIEVSKMARGATADVGRMKAEQIGSRITAQSAAAASKLDEGLETKVQALLAEGPALIAKVTELEGAVNTLWKHTKGVQCGVIEAAEDGASLEERIGDLQGRMTSISTAVETMKMSATKESTASDATLRDRVEKIEEEQGTLKRDLKNASLIKPASDQSPRVATNVGRLTTRLDSIEERVALVNEELTARLNSVDEKIKEEHEDFDFEKGEIIKFVEEKVAAVKNKISPMDEKISGVEQKILQDININAIRNELSRIDDGRVQEGQALKATLDRLARDIDGLLKAQLTDMILVPFQNEIRQEITQAKNRLGALEMRAPHSPASQQQLARASQSPAIQQGQQRPPHFPSPNTQPNGAGPPPHMMVNGFPHHSPHTPPGFANNPPAMPANQGAIPGAIEYLTQRADHLAIVTQHLKQRIDNLTTDEVVEKMLDQLSVLYPHAKNVDAAIAQLQAQLHSLKGNTEAELQDVKARIARCEAAKPTEGLNADVKAVWSAIGAMTKEDQDLSTKLDAVQKDISRVSDVATAADCLSREHSSRFCKMKPETMLKQIAQLEEQVEGHEQKLTTGEAELKRLAGEHVELQKEVAVCGGKVEGMMEALL